LKSMSTLLVAGIMIGYICSAVTDFIVSFADDSDIVNLRGWSLGSFSGMSWENVGTAALIIGVVSVAVFLMSKPIGAYQMGEHYAQSMGVNIRVFRVALIILSSILSACVTAFAGPISFVGIAVPHLIKRAMNTSKPLPEAAKRSENSSSISFRSSVPSFSNQRRKPPALRSSRSARGRV
ncbi:MAG: iron chelate uptake ABC transporter family permease subunit, partial [Desulfovibrio sp.]|nr:iron chelate uptake ABC transporter family permease subunit [Desulfovibrio sp.]